MNVARQESSGHPASGNRQERRQGRRNITIAEKGSNRLSAAASIYSLGDVDSLLDLDDPKALKRQHQLYLSANSSIGAQLQLYRILLGMEVTADAARDALFAESAEQSTRWTKEAHIDKLARNRGVISALTSSVTRAIFQDPSEDAIVSSLLEADFPGDEILREVQRVRGEQIELLKLQIDWLKGLEDSKKKAETATRQTYLETPQSNGELYEPPFPLKDWSLQWTTKPWSTEVQDLQSLPTDSKDSMARAVQEVTRSGIQIKSTSIVNAITFMLTNEQALRHAIATRSRHSVVPNSDWIDVRRGKGRIGVNILKNDGEKSAVFFVSRLDATH